MSELVDFLNRMLDEDEAVARLATRGPWWYDPSKMNAVDHEESVFAGERGAGAITVASTGPCDDVGSMCDADHIARHDPARVLVEVEAKRAIVALHGPSDERNRWCAHCRGTGDAEFPCTTLRILATVFADRPGFDETWRP